MREEQSEPCAPWGALHPGNRVKNQSQKKTDDGNTVHIRTEPKGRDNMFRPECFSMFPSLQTVQIETDFGTTPFHFRWDALLESVQSMPSFIILIVKGDWIEDALSEQVIAMFEKAGWGMTYSFRELTVRNIHLD